MDEGRLAGHSCFPSSSTTMLCCKIEHAWVCRWARRPVRCSRKAGTAGRSPPSSDPSTAWKAGLPEGKGATLGRGFSGSSEPDTIQHPAPECQVTYMGFLDASQGPQVCRTRYPSRACSTTPAPRSSDCGGQLPDLIVDATMTTLWAPRSAIAIANKPNQATAYFRAALSLQAHQ